MRAGMPLAAEVEMPSIACDPMRCSHGAERKEFDKFLKMRRGRSIRPMSEDYGTAKILSVAGGSPGIRHSVSR